MLNLQTATVYGFTVTKQRMPEALRKLQKKRKPSAFALSATRDNTGFGFRIAEEPAAHGWT